MDHKIIENGTAIEFQRPGAKKKFAHITFRDIFPKSVTKTEFGEPELKKKKTRDAHVTNVYNKSDVEVTRGYEVEFSKESTSEESVGVAVETSITQSISYGGAVAEGSTEISLTVSSEYSKTTGITKGESRTTTTELTVPPKTELNLATVRATSTMVQDIEFWCDLDHEIEIYSNNDYKYTWDSLDHLAIVLLGHAKPGGYNLASHYRKAPRSVEKVKKVTAPVNVHYKETIEFEDTTTGDVRVTSKPCE